MPVLKPSVRYPPACLYCKSSGSGVKFGECYSLRHWFIALIAYVESIAIAKVTANLRRQRISPNRELVALGASNLAASISGGMPVAGGFSRTMVNFSAGAVTQVATLIAAALLGLSVIFFTDLFAGILKTSLAAVILVAI